MSNPNGGNYPKGGFIGEVSPNGRYVLASGVSTANTISINTGHTHYPTYPAPFTIGGGSFQNYPASTQIVTYPNTVMPSYQPIQPAQWDVEVIEDEDEDEQIDPWFPLSEGSDLRVAERQEVGREESILGRLDNIDQAIANMQAFLNRHHPGAQVMPDGTVVT